MELPVDDENPCDNDGIPAVWLPFLLLHVLNTTCVVHRWLWTVRISSLYSCSWLQCSGQWRPDGRKTNNEVSQVGSDDSGVGPVICQKHLTFACSCCQPDWKEHRQHNHNPRFIKEMVEITPQTFTFFCPTKQLQSYTHLLLNWTN